MKLIGLIIVLLTGGLLTYTTVDFPDWADPQSPASTHVSPYYIQKAMDETSAPNIVTAVLADYRGFDTMFETTVVFAAGVACFLLLRVFLDRESEQRWFRHTLTGMTLRVKGRVSSKIEEEMSEFVPIYGTWTPHDLIIMTTCRFIIPFIQLFALYVIAHGHHSPGGGFQGGVILGASFILLAISNDLTTALRRMREKADALLCSAGVGIYAGTGALCLLLGANFLDYGALASILAVNAVTARSHGILIVEIGVGITVMATMVWIYNNVSSRGQYDEGL